MSNIKVNNSFDLYKYILEVIGLSAPIENASTTVTGITRLATKAETTTGSSISTAVTPNGLAETPLFEARSVSTNVSAAIKDVMLVDATSGNRIISMPVHTGNDSVIITVKKVDVSVNTVSISTTGLIDGAASPYILTAQWESVTLISKGGNWFIIAKV